MRAVVIAAGLGTRLRPLSEHYPKPVLPVDGRPVVAVLLRELAAAGCRDVAVVVAPGAPQVERLLGDGSGFGPGVRVRYAVQEEPLGSAHAVAAAAPEPPYLVAGADSVFAPGDVRRFLAGFAASGAAGALALQRGRAGGLVAAGGAVERVVGAGGQGAAAAPLWAVGERLAGRVADLVGRPPFALATAFQGAIDAGERVAAVVLSPVRHLTAPVDLLLENFPYLRDL